MKSGLRGSDSCWALGPEGVMGIRFQGFWIRVFGLGVTVEGFESRA